MPRTGLGLLVIAGLIALILTARLLNVLPVGAEGIHDAAFLPGRIHVCGRDWHREDLDRQVTRAQIVAQSGHVPILTDVGILPPCPPGACTSVAESGPCDVVLYVRVAEDRFLGYELSGGP